MRITSGWLLETFKNKPIIIFYSQLKVLYLLILKDKTTMVKCERCNNDSRVMTGSYFNTEMICNPCDVKERNHPDFERARKVENEAVRNGNLNYVGIGLPKDLK